MKRSFAAIVSALVILMALGSCWFSSKSEMMISSDFEKEIRENGIHAVFSEIQKGRSELFPVKGYETEHGWKIAMMENEEVFYCTLKDEAAAEETYLLSCGKENMRSLFLVGADIVYYRGENEGVRAILQKIHNRKSVLFSSGVYHYDDWDDPMGTYEEDVIPNADTAADVAKAILGGMNTGDEAYDLAAVTYDEKNEIWIVDFSLKSENPDSIILGGGYSMAIEKKDGRVLRIWTGE